MNSLPVLAWNDFNLAFTVLNRIIWIMYANTQQAKIYLKLRKLINLSAWHQITEVMFTCSFQDNLESWSYKLTMTHWLCVREFGFHHYNTLPSWLLHHNNALILYSTYLQKYIFPLNLPLFCKTEFFRPKTMFMVMPFNVLHLNTWGNSNTGSSGYNMESLCPYIGLANRWRYTIN